jgi:hypothetical protein
LELGLALLPQNWFSNLSMAAILELSASLLIDKPLLSLLLLLSINNPIARATTTIIPMAA